MRSSLVSSICAPLGASLLAVVLAGCGDQPPPERLTPPEPPPAPTLEQLDAATVSGVFAQPVTLANGVYEGEPAEAGAASRPRLTLWAPTFRTGDVDGEMGNEAVVLLGSTGGGSGEFVHVAVFAMRDGALTNLGTALVGDRARLQNVWLERGRIVMDVVEPGPQEPACCGTQVARKTFALQDGALRQLSSEVRGVLALGMLSANEWTLVEIDGQPLPADLDAPLLHFAGETLRGFAGCNRFTAPVKESKPGEIDVGAAAAERKACPPPQMDLEQKFLAQLDAVSSYTFLAGQLALNWQDGDRSGLLVFRK
jgi:heat shock protein HslJ